MNEREKQVERKKELSKLLKTNQFRLCDDIADVVINAGYVLSPQSLPSVKWPEKKTSQFNYWYIKGWNSCLEACKKAYEERNK